MADIEPIARALAVNERTGSEVWIDLPVSRNELVKRVQDKLGLNDPSFSRLNRIESESLPLMAREGVEDLDMANDLASLAVGLTDEQREAAELYWDNLVSVSEQDRFQAAANVLMQASEIDQWHAYDYYEPEAGWPSPLSNIEKYGRSWYEKNYQVPTIAHYNYDLELYGRRNSDDVRLYDEGYLELSVDWPDIESYDRGAMNGDLGNASIPEVLEDWQKVSIVARSLYNGEEFKATLPMNPTEALDLEEAATLGEKHDYAIVEIEDGGVLDRLGIDATAHPYERVKTLNGLLIMAATRLNANGNDYERVRALINDQADPTYLDVAGAIAGVEEIPFYAYDFPNIDAYDLATMSKEEKWGRTFYDAQAEAGELSEDKRGYDELIDIDFDIKTYGHDHDVTLGDGGYIDAYSGDELNLTFYDDEEIADAAKEAREKIGIADTQVPRDIEQPVARTYIPAPSEPYATQYRMLSRMKGDFDYVLGEGGIGALRQIWDSDGPGSQIAYMRRLLAEIPEEYAPEWISAADIDNYEQRINELVAEQNSEFTGRSESSLEAEARDEAERFMEDLTEGLPGDEPVLNEQEVREMMEDAAMGRGEEPSSTAPDALEELNRRVHEIDGAIVFAEIPETTYSLGIAEVSVDRTPSSETSYYVIYDSEKRHPYGHFEGLSVPALDDLQVIRRAVEKHTPDAPWVRWGLERRVTPWGFKPDGMPYTSEEYREGTGEVEFDMLQPVMNYQEGLSVSEALQQVPNSLPSMIEDPILNAISDGVHDRSLRFRSRGLMSINRNGEPIVIGGRTDNGYVYRNPGAFEDRGDDVAYIANAAWEEPLDSDEQGYVKLSDIDPEHVYTYGRILEDCHGSRVMAERIFAQLDWQHPAALYEEEMQLLAEDWEAAPKSDYMIRQSENVRLFVECKLRERGISGDEFIHAMGVTRAEDLLDLVDYHDTEEKSLEGEMERLNSIARPWAIFAEPVPEGHLVGAVDVLVDTEVPDQKVTVRVIYDWDARPMGPNADDPDYEPYAGDWAVVSAAVEAAFPGRSYEDSGWVDAETLESVLDGAKFPTTRVSEILTANRDAATALTSANENLGVENSSDEPQETQVKQPEWKPGSIAIGRATGMPYVVLAVTESGDLRLGADLSIYDSDMFEQGGQVDEALVESYRQGRDDGTALARALAEATGRPEVGESRIEDLAREQLAKPTEEIRPEKTSSEDKGPWKVGSIAIGRQSGYAFVVMDVTEDGRLLLGADAYVASPDMFEYGGQVPDQVMDDIRTGNITEEELQEVLAGIREKAEREALTGPESEQPTWRVGSIAVDRDTLESHLVTGLTTSGNILIGYDMEPVNAAAYQNVGEVDEEVALGYRNGTIDNDEKNQAMAAVVSEYVTSSRDAGELTEEEIADIERGFEEDFGDLYVRAMAEKTDIVSADNEEPVEADDIPLIDPERSGWYVNGRSGWEFHTYFKGENFGGDSYAICGIEMTASGAFVAIVELNGEQRLDLSPKGSFPTFDRARESGMLSLGSALGLAPEVLAPYVHGEVAPDPYPETWARDEGAKMTAEMLMAKYGFDSGAEYVRTYPDGQWEALYYNPQGNEERGQIVQAWGGDLAAALAEYDPENAQWISTVIGRDNDMLHDWPDDMESLLADFMRHRQDFVGFAVGEPEAQHEYLVQREAYLESMRTLDTERSDIFEDVPGREYQMVAVAVGDEESEHAYVANFKLREDGWSVGVTYDNGAPNRESNGIASFQEAREYAMRMFRAGGRYSAEALNDFEGFQKEFPAVSAESQDSGWRSYESILMNDEWGWEVSPAGVGRLMDQTGEIYTEIHPDRKQVIFRDEPIPGATTWTVDNDDVRLVLEAYAIREAGLDFEPPEGATFDSLIYDVTKSLAKEEGLLPPVIPGVFEPLSNQERFERDVEELFYEYERGLRPSPIDTIYVSETPAILVALGMEQRPIHLSSSHAMRIIHPKDSSKRHYHGLSQEVMLKIPEALATPAFITDALNSASTKDAVIMILSTTDDDGLPLLAAIRPNDNSRYELEPINTNRLMSVYGREGIESFLEAAITQKKILFVDKKKTEELSKASRLELSKSLVGLPLNEIIRRSSVIDKAEGKEMVEYFESVEKLEPADEQAIDEPVQTPPHGIVGSMVQGAAEAIGGAIAGAVLAATPAAPVNPIEPPAAIVASVDNGQAVEEDETMPKRQSNEAEREVVRAALNAFVENSMVEDALFTDIGEPGDALMLANLYVFSSDLEQEAKQALEEAVFIVPMNSRDEDAASKKAIHLIDAAIKEVCGQVPEDWAISTHYELVSPELEALAMSARRAEKDFLDRPMGEECVIRIGEDGLLTSRSGSFADAVAMQCWVRSGLDAGYVDPVSQRCAKMHAGQLDWHFDNLSSGAIAKMCKDVYEGRKSGEITKFGQNYALVMSETQGWTRAEDQRASIGTRVRNVVDAIRGRNAKPEPKINVTVMESDQRQAQGALDRDGNLTAKIDLGIKQKAPGHARTTLLADERSARAKAEALKKDAPAAQVEQKKRQ